MRIILLIIYVKNPPGASDTWGISRLDLQAYFLKPDLPDQLILDSQGDGVGVTGDRMHLNVLLGDDH